MGEDESIRHIILLVEEFFALLITLIGEGISCRENTLTCRAADPHSMVTDPYPTVFVCGFGRIK